MVQSAWRAVIVHTDGHHHDRCEPTTVRQWQRAQDAGTRHPLPSVANVWQRVDSLLEVATYCLRVVCTCSSVCVSNINMFASTNANSSRTSCTVAYALRTVALTVLVGREHL